LLYIYIYIYTITCITILYIFHVIVIIINLLPQTSYQRYFYNDTPPRRRVQMKRKTYYCTKSLSTCSRVQTIMCKYVSRKSSAALCTRDSRSQFVSYNNNNNVTYMFDVILLKYNLNGFKNKLRQTDFAPLVHGCSVYGAIHSVSCSEFCFLIFLNTGEDHISEFSL